MGKTFKVTEGFEKFLIKVIAREEEFLKDVKSEYDRGMVEGLKLAVDCFRVWTDREEVYTK